MKLTAHLHLASMLRINYLHSSIRPYALQMGNFMVRFATNSIFAIITHLDNVVNLSNYSEEEIISNFVSRVYNDRLIDFSQYLQLRTGL